MSFMSIRVHFSKLPNFQYLKIIFFIYIYIYSLVCSVVLGGKVSPTLVKVEVYFSTQYLFISVLEHIFFFSVKFCLLYPSSAYKWG